MRFCWTEKRQLECTHTHARTHTLTLAHKYIFTLNSFSFSRFFFLKNTRRVNLAKSKELENYCKKKTTTSKQDTLPCKVCPPRFMFFCNYGIRIGPKQYTFVSKVKQPAKATTRMDPFARIYRIFPLIKHAALRVGPVASSRTALRNNTGRLTITVVEKKNRNVINEADFGEEALRTLATPCFFLGLIPASLFYFFILDC